MRQTADHVQAWIVLSAFDPADIGPVRFGTFGQFLLRQAKLFAQSPEAAPECRPKVVHGIESWAVQVAGNIGDLLYSGGRHFRERHRPQTDAGRSTASKASIENSKELRMLMAAVTERTAADHVECPLCAGRGSVRGRARRSDGPVQYRCALCAGTGVVRRL